MTIHFNDVHLRGEIFFFLFDFVCHFSAVKLKDIGFRKRLLFQHLLSVVGTPCSVRAVDFAALEVEITEHLELAGDGVHAAMKHRPAAFRIVLDELDIDGFGHVVDAIPCDVRCSRDLLSFREFHVGVALPEVATHRVGMSPGHNPAELALGRSARIVGGGKRIRKAEFRMLFNTVFFVRTVPYLVRISTGKEPVIRNVSFIVKYAILVKTANVKLRLFS